MYKISKILKNVNLSLISILILSFLLRVYKLGKDSLWGDEAYSDIVSKASIIKIPYLDIHPPLYYFVLHYWIKLVGDSDFLLRFPSLIFGVLSIYIIYKIGLSLFNKEVGILSALILSISLYHIRYSQETRMYTLLTLLILLSNLYLIDIIKKERKKKKYIEYIIVSILAIYTHIFALFYLIFQNIYYILIYRKNIKYWIISQVMILVAFIPWIGQIFKNLHDGRISWIKEPTIFDIYDLFKSFAGNDKILYFFITICMIGLIVFIYKEYKIKNSHSIKYDSMKYLMMWLFIPIILSFIASFMIKPILVSRYLIPSLPAFVLIFSKGIYEGNKKIVILGLLIILSLFTLSSIVSYYQNPQKDQWKEISNYLENNSHKNDNIIIYGYNCYNVNLLERYYQGNSKIYCTSKNSNMDIDKIIKTEKDKFWLIRKRNSRLSIDKILMTYDKGLNAIFFNNISVSLYIK